MKGLESGNKRPASTSKSEIKSGNKHEKIHG